MDIYEIVKTQVEHGVRLDRLETRLDQRFRLVNRTGLVAALWIAAVLIFTYASEAAVATAGTIVKLLIVVK